METKIYTKVIDGVTVRKRRTNVILEKDGMQIINPTEEMLFKDGWVEYVAPEMSLEEKLVIAKNDKVAQINDYDKSKDVNIFFVQSEPVWLDKETRTGLMLRLTAEEVAGKTETTLWYNGMPFTFELEQGRQMLYLIENYASACFDATQQHIANVMMLETLEAVETYDHTTNYPEKLRF